MSKNGDGFRACLTGHYLTYQAQVGSEQIVSKFCIDLTCNSSKYLYLLPSLGT